MLFPVAVCLLTLASSSSSKVFLNLTLSFCAPTLPFPFLTMSAAPARNWAAMLKEKKAAAPQAGAAAKPVVVVAPTSEPAKPATPTPVEPTPAPEAAAAVVAPAAPQPALTVGLPKESAKEETVLSPISVDTPVAAAAPKPTHTSMGPVSLSAALAKLVQQNEFRFVGSVAPRAPAVTAAAAAAAAAQPVAPATPPAPIAPAPTVTSSSELRGHPQWTAPQPVYNPPVQYFVPQQNVARPYGGELGSVPRHYSAERHFNPEQHHQAQPYHPTYQTPYHNFRGGYGGNAYNSYDNVYPSYYPGQGAPYMGGRLQAQQPYYPPRNYPPQQYQQQQYQQHQ